MFWTIVLCWLTYGGIMHLVMYVQDDSWADYFDAKEKGADEKKVAELKKYAELWDKIFNVTLGIGIAGLAIILLYCLGWVWYFFCGGFLVFEDQPFWDKVMCGLISLIPLGFVLGFIAIIGGWDPDK